MQKNQKIYTEPWAESAGWNVKDFEGLKTPCYVVDEKKLKRNLEILARVQKDCGVKIIMALKGFAMFSVFPLIKKYLFGVGASSLNEARLGFEEFGGEIHVFSPAFLEEEFNEMTRYASHIIFNSFSQWKKYRSRVFKNKKKISCGLRVNPEHSEVEVALYDPCGENSRLGVARKNFEADELAGIEGLHFHNLCERNADSFERTLKVFEKKFGEFLPKMKWVNFGGGHHITRKDYDIKLLRKVIKDFKKRFPHLEIYLEPGEAISLNAGVLVATVQDIIVNGLMSDVLRTSDIDRLIPIAILDTSFTCHMPDALEMPYRPSILGAGEPGEFMYNYRFGGISCLAGDTMGDYSFKKPLTIGSKIIFLNMAHYTMVKNTTFNGINLPLIILRDRSGKFWTIKKFGHSDFKDRLS